MRFLMFWFIVLGALNVSANTQAPRSDISIDTLVHSASELDYPPYCIVTKGKADGFSVELLKEVLHVMHYDVDFYVNEWSVVKKDLEEGKIDVLPLVGRTPEREVYFDFSVPYLSMHGAIVVRKDTKSIHSFEDLQGKNLLVMKNDNAHEFLLRQRMNLKFIETATFEEALTRLSKGEGDAVVVQKLVGTQLIEKLKLTNLTILSSPITNFKQDFSFAVKIGNKKLLADLNEGLSIVLANGEYTKLYQKWLAPLDRNETQNKNLILTLFSIIGILLCLGAFASIWQRALKNQVVLKTNALVKSEQKLKNLNASLESKIQKAIQEIQAKDNLMIAQSRQAAMGEMISMIAHQWRQPLGVIGMIANNLTLDVELNETIAKTTILEAMKDISKQVTHLSNTIDDFRNFLKPMKEKQHVLVSEIINDTLMIVGKSLHNNHIECIVEHENDKAIEVYKNEVLHVLINIINNAKDALLSNKTQQGKIRIKIVYEKAKIALHICDNAGGIRKDILEKLGEPYVSSKALSGTGLGIYMSKMIVEKHLKGELVWKNEQEGACFTLYLPLKA